MRHPEKILSLQTAYFAQKMIFYFGDTVRVSVGTVTHDSFCVGKSNIGVENSMLVVYVPMEHNYISGFDKVSKRFEEVNFNTITTCRMVLTETADATFILGETSYIGVQILNNPYQI